jgi:acetoin utilization deacetylase AcuC-like enzyme
MAHGASEADFLGQLEVALAAVKDFGAQVLVLSLGFDIFELDPQSKVAVTREGFALLGERIRSLGLPCLIVQEGGYHLESLEDNAQAFFVGPEVWQL